MWSPVLFVLLDLWTNSIVGLAVFVLNGTSSSVAADIKFGKSLYPRCSASRCAGRPLSPFDLADEAKYIGVKVVDEVAGEDAGSEGEDAREYAYLFGVRGGTVDGAIDDARCDAVHARGEGGGLAFFFSLSCFGPEHVDDHGVDRMEPCAVEGLSFGKPDDEPSSGVRGSFVDA